MRPVRFIPALLMTFAAAPGSAEEAGKWRIGGGIQVERYSNIEGHTGTYQFARGDIEDTVERGTVSVEYHLSDHWGIGADLALPAPLSIQGPRAGLDARTSSITAMGRYYFDTRRNVRPFAGLGMVYSVYDKEKLKNSQSKARPDIENTLSPALALGVEIPGKKREIIRAELGYHRSSSKILVNDRPRGELNLHPVRVNITYLMRF